MGSKTRIKPTVALIGFPMDLGADRRGVDMGPSALRIAGIRERLDALGYHTEDLGDIHIQIKERQVVDNPRLKYLAEIVKTSEHLAAMIQSVLEASRFPICMGGDHAMALGTIAGIAAFCQKAGKTPGVIWIDAHADMNTDDTTPSGNIHGMPLAASLGRGHRQLTHLMGFGPKLTAENCALIGARRLDPGEKAMIQDVGLPVYTMADIDRRGIAVIMDEVLSRLFPRVSHLHVSFDMDSVDPGVATGVGTPVPGGLSYRETHFIMEAIAECGCMGSLEVAEVNPILDHRNRSAEFAAELVASSMGLRIL